MTGSPSLSVTVTTGSSGARLLSASRCLRSRRNRSLTSGSTARPCRIARVNSVVPERAVGAGRASRRSKPRSPRIVATICAMGSATRCLAVGLHLGVVVTNFVETTLMICLTFVIVKMAFLTIVMLGRGCFVIVGVSVARGTVVVDGFAVCVIICVTV